jgi:hypothetical protein
MTEEIDNYIHEYITKYIEMLELNEKINSKLSCKKIRNENFPSHISENLVKFALNKIRYNNSNNKVIWNTTVGDLELDNRRIEVKAFMSDAPSSFGPTEKWDIIYFVDAKNIQKGDIIIYEILLSNTNDIWLNINISSKETYMQQCINKRRPRIVFSKLLQQIPKEYVNILYEGKIRNLLPS